MIIRVLLAALAAGLLAGILMTPLQYTKVIPIIKHAEMFEGGHSHDHGAASAKVDHVHSDGTAHSAEHEVVTATDAEKAGAHTHSEPAEASSAKSSSAHEEEPLFLGRFWNTLFTGLVTGAGFALLLAGVSMAAGVNVTFSTGLVWGVLGWLCVQFLPSLGLPPALPGFPHADLSERQVWWVATVGLSIIGFWLMLLTKSQATRALGMVALLAPHLYSAPQPVDISSAVPAYLAAQYVVATLATTLFFWVALGLALGFFMDRMKIEER
ncbi:MAG: CbtA family protein [Rhizobiaceae bacterium]